MWSRLNTVITVKLEKLDNENPNNLNKIKQTVNLNEKIINYVKKVARNIIVLFWIYDQV